MPHACGLVIRHSSFVIRHFPRPHSAFAGSFRDGFSGRVAEGKEHVFRTLRLVSRERIHGFEKSGEAEIRITRSAIHAIEKRGDVDELRARVHEVKVEQFVPCHFVNSVSNKKGGALSHAALL